MEQPRKVLSPGTMVICPMCKRTMAILRAEIKSGDKLDSSKFEPVEAPCQPQTRMECPYDRTAFAVGGNHARLYVTEYEGWV